MPLKSLKNINPKGQVGPPLTALCLYLKVNMACYKVILFEGLEEDGVGLHLNMHGPATVHTVQRQISPTYDAS